MTPTRPVSQVGIRLTDPAIAHLADLQAIYGCESISEAVELLIWSQVTSDPWAELALRRGQGQPRKPRPPIPIIPNDVAFDVE